MGVRGCGAKATYIENCEVGSGQYGTYKHTCTWVLNADARADRSAGMSGGLGTGVGEKSD